MEMPSIEELIGVGLTVGVTGGGLWFVITLIIRFQRDFLARYREELTLLVNEAHTRDGEISDIRKRLRDCEDQLDELR